MLKLYKTFHISIMLKNWLNKILKKRREPRKGYFLILFALILTMLILPIIARTLEHTITVRENIAAYNKASSARYYGESVLLSKLTQRRHEYGLGYFESGEILKDEETGESVSYRYSAASTIPVPTSYDLGPGVDCENAYELGNYECEDIQLRTDNEGGTATPRRFYYTVPALGTGNASQDCRFNKVNFKKNYPGTEAGQGEPVDPLDDPCNWNKLALGQNTTFPLYINPPDDPTQLKVYHPRTLKLRVRMRCAGGIRDLCVPEDRLVISHEDVNPLEFEARFDLTPRVLDWVIQSADTFTPDVRGDFDDPDTKSGRNVDNIEITINKLRLDDPILDFFRFNESNKTSIFNLLDTSDVKIAEIQEAFDKDSIYEPLADKYETNQEGFIEGIINFEPTSNGNLAYVVEEGPDFILGFINAYFEGCSEVDVGFHCTRGKRNHIIDVEYQMISDVPLGNDKFVSTGRFLTGEGEKGYSLQQQSRRGPKVHAPGLVFGN